MKAGLQSQERLIQSADAISDRVLPIIRETGILAPSDIIAALREAKRKGADVTCASSPRSVSIIMDRLCETV